LSNLFDDFFTLKAGIGDRLREARGRQALKQSDLAATGGISRATQVSYETGATEPTTAYLRQVQASGIDIPFVLFGHSNEETNTVFGGNSSIDWQRLQQAYEHVDYFLMRFAPACPSSYRWKMVSELYTAIQQNQLKNHVGDGLSEFDPLPLIESIWTHHGKRS